MARLTLNVIREICLKQPLISQSLERTGSLGILQQFSRSKRQLTLLG